MTKWLGPLAYFGAIFGAEGEAQPGVMDMVASGLGGCSVSPKGFARGALSARGSSAFQGAIEAAQQAQTVDIGLVASGSGSVSATLSTVAPVAPSEFFGRAFWRPVSTPVVFRVPANASAVVQGTGRMSSAIRANACLGMVATGAGLMSAAATTTEAVEDTPLEDLALILALAA